MRKAENMTMLVEKNWVSPTVRRAFTAVLGAVGAEVVSDLTTRRDPESRGKLVAVVAALKHGEIRGGRNCLREKVTTRDIANLVYGGEHRVDAVRRALKRHKDTQKKGQDPRFQNCIDAISAMVSGGAQ